MDKIDLDLFSATKDIKLIDIVRIPARKLLAKRKAQCLFFGQVRKQTSPLQSVASVFQSISTPSSHTLEAMKFRFTLLASTIVAFAGPALAQDALFTITTTQPGSMIFNGVGTATYNNSLGTGNSINLGSSSSLNVSNSVSATGDYHGSSSSYLQLQDTTAFQQTIGTSSQAANSQATAQAAETAASTTAESKANETVTAQLGYSYENYLDKYNAAEASTATQGDVAGTTASDGSTAAYTESQWGEATSQLHTESYNTAYSDAYSAVSSNSQTQQASNSASGVVKGIFNTTNSGSADNSNTIETFTETASHVADGKYGDSWNATQISDGSGGFVAAGTNAATHDANGFTETEYEDAWEKAFSGSMSSSVGSAQNVSTSDSTVEGIGNIANVTTSGESNFAVDLAARAPGDISPENGSANGSAGAALSTNSNVAVNNTQFSSAFIQAFAPE